jgi:hypothetical protein
MWVQVLLVQDSIAIVEGLNSDCEVGTALVFSSGATGYVVQHILASYSSNVDHCF